MKIHPDFRDLLSEFARAGVRYLIVGGFAVSFHARPRSTKDIDLWVDGAPENLAACARALRAFGAPASLSDAVEKLGPTDVVYFGSPPVRVDVLRTIEGVEFADAWARRVTDEWDGIPVAVISADDLLRNKRAVGRPQDLIDAAAIERARRLR